MEPERIASDRCDVKPLVRHRSAVIARAACLAKLTACMLLIHRSHHLLCGERAVDG